MKFLYKTDVLKADNKPFSTEILIWLLTGLLFISLSISFTIKAEPYLAIKNNLKCAACHVNPNGGGLRNDFGRIYGQNLLPAKASSYDSGKLARLTQYLTVGADSRFNGTYQKTAQKSDNTSQGFEISSTQLYLNIEIPDSGLSLYIDQQVAPGSAINREALVMYQFEQNNLFDGSYLKAGKLFLPYGLRIEDDSAFIRQVTGMNFDNSDNGVEYGVSYKNTSANFYVANGTSQASNNDDSLLYGLRVEHLFSSFRLGMSAVLNDGDQQVQMLNLYGGAQWRDLTFLAEIDYLTLEKSNSFTQQDIKQLVTLAEVNYQWRQGWNFKLTAEFFDPDQDVDEDEQTRYSFITEYTPLSNVQLRLGFRLKQDIPQKPQQNSDMVFIQSHFYF
ncbi:MAG: hypothetical protein HRT54_01145 [Colwellia sp.]|nr:hypothetical protein [Colwellia sp.]